MTTVKGQPARTAARDRARPTGAYGLRVSGIDADRALIGEVREGAPPLHMAFRGRPASLGRSSIDGDRAVFVLDAGRELVVDRATACATYSSPRPPLAADVVHPLLTAAAASVGLWAGHDLFHAAAIVVDDRVWGLLGDKQSGKSTFAACLAQRGHPVVCDDLLAVRGRTALAGARCLDLRPDAADRLGVGEPVPTEGSRERWRVILEPVAAEIGLAGWMLLSWADTVEAVRIGPRELLGRLAAHRTWRGLAIDPARLLDLAALPAWELRRPRAWTSLERVADAMETATARR